jgi:hypothetical protein
MHRVLMKYGYTQVYARSSVGECMSVGYYSGPSKVNHQPGAMCGGGVCLLTPHITGWRSGGGEGEGGVLPRPMQCLKRGRGERSVLLASHARWGRGGGRDYPVLEFLNNLWGLGTG